MNDGFHRKDLSRTLCLTPLNMRQSCSALDRLTRCVTLPAHRSLTLEG